MRVFRKVAPGFLVHHSIAVAKRRGIKVVADAKPAEFDLVRSSAPTSSSNLAGLRRSGAPRCPFAFVRHGEAMRLPFRRAEPGSPSTRGRKEAMNLTIVQ
jgi:hypothetical protein